ncbi:Hint domain-containing protein [Priestia megaterium]|uniref:Hint domain-containing protein n=1 Tax=Priestia megaterium TaxID=1404 RepID=UPI000E2026FA|nr:Hint domain-containing protein [Priestia megaterium]
MIETEIGLMDIVDLVEMKKPPRVLSFDHKTSTLAYKKILARRRKRANEFTRVTTASGNQVISTGDHRFYTHQRGYWKASFLRYGDRFTTYGIKKKYSLQSMWSGKGRPRFFLQTLLSAIQKIIGHFRMYPLQKALRKGTL